MDARITKSRLSNLLSYDWLKIIAAIIFAVLGLVVFFTTVGTRVGKHQLFTIYGYREIVAGESASGFADGLLSRGVFSYDILDAELETFGTNEYSETAFAARRSAELGTVMFTTTNLITDETTGESSTVLQNLAGGKATEIALDLEQYFIDCEQYLIRFFGENWTENPLNGEEAEKCFLKRNGHDKRFRSDEKKAEGIELEKARLEKLREDFLAVRGFFGDGTLTFSYVKDESGNDRAAAIALGGLPQIRKLYFYTTEEDGKTVQATANVCLMLFRNDWEAGLPADVIENDLRYEPVSFVRYLVDRFGA